MQINKKIYRYRIKQLIEKDKFSFGSVDIENDKLIIVFDDNTEEFYLNEFSEEVRDELILDIEMEKLLIQMLDDEFD